MTTPLSRPSCSMSLSGTKHHKRFKTEYHNPVPSNTLESQRAHWPSVFTPIRVRSTQRSSILGSHQMLRRETPLIPSEIIHECLKGLDKRYFPTTSLINRAWSAISCELLYTGVYLSRSAPNVGSTVAFLEANTRLVNLKIKTAVLETCSSTCAGVGEWISVDFFKGWDALTVLELNGMPFDDEMQMKAFSHCITHSCPSLATLVVRPSPDSLSMLPFLCIRAHRLSQLVIECTRETSSMDIKPLLSAIQLQLTHLHFMGRIDYCLNTSFYAMLNDMMFPSLVSFQICHLDCDIQFPHTPSINQPLAQFIFRHTRLQHLSMGKSSITSRIPPRLVNDNGMEGNIPKLKSLAFYFGRPKEGTIETMIRRLEEMKEGIRQVPFTSASPQMRTSDVDDDIPRRKTPFMVSNSWEHVDSPFRDAPYLKLDFDDDRSHYRPTNLRAVEVHDAIVRMKDLCPNVVILDLKLVCELDCLAEKILNWPSLERLECLIIPRLCVLSPHENETVGVQQRIALMEKMASACPQLKYVLTRKPEYSNLPDCVFTLHRDSALEESWPNFSQRLRTVDQKFMDDGLDYLGQFNLGGIKHVESV